MRPGTGSAHGTDMTMNRRQLARRQQRRPGPAHGRRLLLLAPDRQHPTAAAHCKHTQTETQRLKCGWTAKAGLRAYRAPCSPCTLFGMQFLMLQRCRGPWQSAREHGMCGAHDAMCGTTHQLECMQWTMRLSCMHCMQAVVSVLQILCPMRITCRVHRRWSTTLCEASRQVKRACLCSIAVPILERCWACFLTRTCNTQTSCDTEAVTQKLYIAGWRQLNHCN